MDSEENIARNRRPRYEQNLLKKYRTCVFEYLEDNGAGGNTKYFLQITKPTSF
jgi:hypothetical protein